MNKLLLTLSLFFSFVSLCISGFIAYKTFFQSKIKIGTVSYEYLKRIGEGDNIFVSGYLIKKGNLFELHQSKESVNLPSPNGFPRVTIFHPADNIKPTCNNSWVNVSGIADWTGWGDSIDLIRNISNLETGESCLVNSGKAVKYLDLFEQESGGRNERLP